MNAQTRDRRYVAVICLVFGIITLTLYLPVVRHEFIQYDDQQYVTENPRVQAGLTWHGLIWAFGYHAGNWHPLAWISHMLDCQIYGARAGGHHFTNVLLHVASTLLLFLVLNRMTAKLWRSAIVAALFAWHPLHVESVAWVAERKDVLCAFFWMLTLLLYVRYAAKPSVSRYILIAAAFMLCLMAKPMGVTLPFVLLLLDYWPLKRMQEVSARDPQEVPAFAQKSWRNLIWEKVPLIALSAAACALTISVQQLAIVSTAGLPISQRLIHVLVAYSHYVVAMFAPINLAVYYPFQKTIPISNIVCAALVLGLITLFAVKNFRRRPYIAFGWLWYLGTLVPVIGLVQVGDQAWADRYTYLPFIGLFVPLAWLAFEVIKNRAVLLVLTAVVGAAMLAATSVQLRYWRNTRTLFERTANVTERNALAVTMLGSLLAQDGKFDEAIKYYQTALSYEPRFPEAHFFLGNALDEKGKLDEALAEYEQALWFRPTQEQVHIFMGIALGKQKKYDEAIAHYREALALNPDSAATHNNLARLYHSLGQFDAAIEHYNAALEIDPRLSIAHNNLGILLIQKGNLEEGVKHLREAVKLRPKNMESKFNLALALNQLEQWSEAAELFKATQNSYSTDPKAHYEFGIALFHLKKTREAMSEFAAALLVRPDFPDALDSLAWILSTDINSDSRNGTEAVKMAERACELSERRDPAKLKTLAAAYAEIGRFEDAINTVRAAKDLAAQSKREELANKCQRMLERFGRGEPWRE
jgi:tetratricopeptide (TPR) repeat protein